MVWGRRALALFAICLLLLGRPIRALAEGVQGFVLFRDFYGTLTRSALDGRSGQELAITGLPNVPLGNYFQSLDAGRKFAIFMPKSKDLETVSIHDAATARLLFATIDETADAIAGGAEREAMIAALKTLLRRTLAP